MKDQNTDEVMAMVTIPQNIFNSLLNGAYKVGQLDGLIDQFPKNLYLSTIELGDGGVSFGVISDMDEASAKARLAVVDVGEALIASINLDLIGEVNESEGIEKERIGRTRIKLLSDKHV